MSEQKEQDNKQQTQGGGSHNQLSQQPGPESVTIQVPHTDREQSRTEPGLRSTLGRYKDGLLQRPIQYDVIMIIFALLILSGGVYGFVKHESYGSLLAGVLFAVLLGVGTYFEGSYKNPYPLLVTLAFLLAMFAYRYTVKWKFMPSGLFTLLTAIVFLRHCYIVYLKKKQTRASS